MQRISISRLKDPSRYESSPSVMHGIGAGTFVQCRTNLPIHTANQNARMQIASVLIRLHGTFLNRACFGHPSSKDHQRYGSADGAPKVIPSLKPDRALKQISVVVMRFERWLLPFTASCLSKLIIQPSLCSVFFLSAVVFVICSDS